MHPLFLQATDPSRGEVFRTFLRDYWFVLVPTVLGFLAVYWLLPDVRRSRAAWGAAAGGLAIVLAGILLIHGTGIWPETVLFYAFALVAVLGGGLLVTQSNPVYAALSFALVILSSCGLFLLNGAPFLMAATIIIYAGAIVVTFLFVIMLAQQTGMDDADLRSREPLLASVAGFVLLASLLGVLYRTFDMRELNELRAELSYVADAKSLDELDRRYGPLDLKHLGLPFTDKLRKYLPDTPDEDKNYTRRLDILRSKGKLDALRKAAVQTQGALEQVRVGYGTVAPGNAASGKLPRENVTALGQVLFTDYLVPVVLAALLLLVATIGAIAIAGRRGEALR